VENEGREEKDEAKELERGVITYALLQNFII
jgi:hypothetical protein